MNRYLLIYLVLLGVTLISCKSTYIGGYAATPKINIDYNLKVDLKIDTSKVLQATSTTSIYFKLIKNQYLILKRICSLFLIKRKYRPNFIVMVFKNKKSSPS